MSFAILAGMTLAAATAPVPVHQVTIAHSATPVTAAYHATATLDTREVNTTPATRPGVGACHWTASVQVQRAVTGAANAPVAALARAVGTPTRISGVSAGLCAGAKANIDAQVASRIGKMQAGLSDIAQADRATLVAELDGLATLNRDI